MAVLALALLGVGVALVAVQLVTQAPDAARRVFYPLRYEEAVRQAAAEHGLEPALVAGVAHTESRFDPEAVSSQGAYGVMQILPGTAEFIAGRSGIQGDYRDPEVNVRMGAWYLRYLLGRYDGDERLALAAYNGGEGRVDSWLASGDFDVRRDIPFEETRNYVENVLEAEQVYAELYGRDLRGG